MPDPDGVAHAAALGVLRWGYLAPDADAWRVVRSPEWPRELAARLDAAGVGDAARWADGLRAAAQGFADADEWAGEASRALGPGGPVSPHETDYTASNPFMQANDLADIRGFYAAFGVCPSATQAERADHVAAEAEFLHLLAWQARQEAKRGRGAPVHADAVRKFLEAHLGRFAGAFARDAAQAGLHPFFATLAAATAAVVQHAVETLGLHPAPPSRTRPGNAEPDEMQCAGCPAVQAEGAAPRPPS